MSNVSCAAPFRYGARITSSSSTPERPYGGRDHDVRVSERRERFVQAGIRLFGSVGYHGTTVRALCAEAGLSSRYFSESFASTEALLITVYGALMDDCQAQIRTALMAAPGVEAMASAGVRVFFERARDPLFARVTLAEVLGVSPAVDAMYLENTRQFAQLIVVGARARVDQRAVSDAEAEMLAVSLVGSLAYAALHWMRRGYPLSVEQMVQNAMRLMRGALSELEREALHGGG